MLKKNLQPKACLWGKMVSQVRVRQERITQDTDSQHIRQKDLLRIAHQAVKMLLRNTQASEKATPLCTPEYSNAFRSALRVQVMISRQAEVTGLGVLPIICPF